MTLIESSSIKTHGQPTSIQKPHSTSYLTAVQPLETSLAVSSQQNVLLLDRTTFKPRSVIPHQTRVSKLTGCSHDLNAVASADFDGNVWIWDQRMNGEEATSITVKSTKGKKAPIQALDLDTSNHALAAGTELVGEDASVVIWDIRNTSQHMRRYDELHSDDISALKFLPNKHLLTAGTDGLLMYVDPKIEDDNDASLGCVNVGASIANAGQFSDGSIFAFTDMQTAGIYTLDSESELTLQKDLGDIRQRSIENRWESDYIINMSEINNEAVLFAGKTSGEFSMIRDMQTDAMKLERIMKGGHTELVRAVTYDNQLNAIVSVAEDAKIAVWNVQDASDGFRLERPRDDDDDDIEMEENSFKKARQ
ncbi:WD40 repeat-like protein [Wallemia mellicola]|uniref:WD40 repeat-like protein n=1 Tax=Wallemia mellicola TaxID=1708541 RepID=A0A4T0M6L8_9BASI|nr:WD40 repeat-like protein [Wallemia mellicola]